MGKIQSSAIWASLRGSKSWGGALLDDISKVHHIYLLPANIWLCFYNYKYESPMNKAITEKISKYFKIFSLVISHYTKNFFCEIPKDDDISHGIFKNVFMSLMFSIFSMCSKFSILSGFSCVRWWQLSWNQCFQFLSRRQIVQFLPRTQECSRWKC